VIGDINSRYNIPPTLHKVLVHGKDLIDHCPLPIGLTNEEAGEGNNKILRRVRLYHSRCQFHRPNKSMNELENRIIWMTNSHK